jgi:hypothetical protein
MKSNEKAPPERGQGSRGRRARGARPVRLYPRPPMNNRRFPAPWRADKIPGGYAVRDANGQALAYVYSRDNKDEARQAKVLTKDEARRIANGWGSRTC